MFAPGNCQFSKGESGKPVNWDAQLPKDRRIIYPCIVDRSGVIWTGTTGYGLRRYNTTGNKFKSQLPQFSVRCIIPALNNQLFVGDFGAKWKTLKPASIEDDPLLKIWNLASVDNFLITKTGEYWIRTNQKLYYSYKPSAGKLVAWPAINNDETNDVKTPMLEDSKGYIWLPGAGGHHLTCFHGIKPY